jgi:hypothetical protein
MPSQIKNHNLLIFNIYFKKSNKKKTLSHFFCKKNRQVILRCLLVTTWSNQTIRVNTLS